MEAVPLRSLVIELSELEDSSSVSFADAFLGDEGQIMVSFLSFFFFFHDAHWNLHLLSTQPLLKFETFNGWIWVLNFFFFF